LEWPDDAAVHSRPDTKAVLGDNLDILATVRDESVDLVFMAGLDGLAIYPASP